MTGRRLEGAFSDSEELAHFHNFLWVLKESLWSQKKNIVVNKESVGIDKDLTKDRNLKTFKMYCKRRSGARFPDRNARNRLYACHCIVGHGTAFSAVQATASCFGASNADTLKEYLRQSVCKTSRRLRSFLPSCIVVWNSLPVSCTPCSSPHTFLASLDKHFSADMNCFGL